MADKIQLLPDTVANQIAAGEVVQRPSSVVKELLENAVDAQATHVSLIIKDAGSRLLQVVDNGVGMSHTDARMCWERHATSKIRKAEDLYAIKTFGFRGEALASIASVARVDMLSKMKDKEVASHIVIEGGHIKKHDFAAGPNGTNIAVKDLFYNIPARRNFLKSETIETKHIIEEFTRAALVHSSISYTFFNNDRLVMELHATDAKSRLVDVFGRVKHAELLEVKEESPIVTITGFVGLPQLAKKNRGDQYLYVNDRYIKDHYLNHAIKAAYQQLIPNDMHPLYCLFLKVSPERLDVNVHPSKTEVKFEDEKALYAILMASIKKTLGALISIPSQQTIGNMIGLSPNSPSHFVPNTVPNPQYNPEQHVNKRFNPFGQDMPKPKSAYGWEKLIDPFNVSQNEVLNQDSSPIVTKPAVEPDLFDAKFNSNTPIDSVFQFEDLLIARAYGTLYLVNIFLARERIWYERYLKTLKKRNAATQQLLFPKTLVFSLADAELLEGIVPHIRSLGFDIAAFGNNSFIVNGLPADLPKGNEMRIIEGVLAVYKENQSKHNLTEQENIARSMAKNAAVMAPKVLQELERSALLTSLFTCDFPKYCPFGRPVFIQLPRNEISQMFKI